MSKILNWFPFIHKSALPFYAILLVFLVPVFYYTVYFTPSIIVGDRLNLLAPVYLNQSVMEGFFHQHGSHFLGITHLITSAFVTFLGKSPDVDVFAGWLSLILLLALILLLRKKHNDASLTWKDIPLIIIPLSLAPAKSFYFFPHVHYMLPVFALAFSLSWYVKSALRRTLLQSVLLFTAPFSGYAFISVVVFVLLDLAFYKQQKSKVSTILKELICKYSVLLFAFILFITKYNFPKPTRLEGNPTGFDAFYFVELLQNATGMAWSVKGLWVFPFIVLFLIVIFISVFRKMQWKADLPVFNILMAVVFFAVISGVSRSGYEANAGHAPRYYTTLMLLPLGLYYISSKYLKNPILQYCWIFVALCAYFIPLKPAISDGAFYKEKVINWKKCHDAHNDIERCNGEAEMEVVPNHPKYIELYHLQNTGSPL